MKRFAVTKFLIALGACMALFIALRAPAVQNSYLRYFVASKVVMVSNAQRTSGGTGFLLEAPSGETIVITNAHVCALREQTTLYVENQPARVLRINKAADLCALKPLSNLGSGLKLRSSPAALGEIVFAVGHPKLQPTTVTSGEYAGDMEIMIGDAMVSDPEECAEGTEPFITPFFVICASRHWASSTTASILPGNSGSPAVDYRGRVLGVMFASDESNRGFMIRHDDVKSFLEGL